MSRSVHSNVATLDATIAQVLSINSQLYARCRQRSSVGVGRHGSLDVIGELKCHLFRADQRVGPGTTRFLARHKLLQ